VSKEALFLGVDGGGTKTALCLIDESGRRLSELQAPSIYYFGRGIDLVEDVLSTAVATACSQAGVTTLDIEHAFVGFPGYGEASQDTVLLDEIPLRVLGHDRYTCGNDMVCAWAGSLAAQDGINVVSGTGSMTYGECDGHGARAGGWGELFGDEGSGYWIGVRGLASFSHMSDGRLKPGPLLSAMRTQMNLARDYDAVGVVINEWQGSRSKIAALSRVVTEAAAQGDTSARAILAEAGRELASLVEATRRRLPFSAADVIPVSYSGGVFNIETVLSAFTRETLALDSAYDVRRPLLDPVTGAALYAAKRAGRPLGTSAVRRLGAIVALSTER
jgi:N-acetylglucosamine kinase-like BadF-type ATPase